MGRRQWLKIIATDLLTDWMGMSLGSSQKSTSYPETEANSTRREDGENGVHSIMTVQVLNIKSGWSSKTLEVNEWHSNVRAGAVGDGLKTIGGCASQVVMALPSRMMFGSEVVVMFGGDNHNATVYNEDLCG